MTSGPGCSPVTRWLSSGDTEAALAHFQTALPLAQQARDYKTVRDLSARIFRLTRPAGEAVQRR